MKDGSIQPGTFPHNSPGNSPGNVPDNQPDNSAHLRGQKFPPAWNVSPKRLNFAILTYNALDFTKMCLESIYKNTETEFNVFVLDNRSKDDTPAWLSQHNFPNMFVEVGHDNLGVPKGRNRLIQLMRPYLAADSFVCFIDNDIEVLPKWDRHYIEFFSSNPKAGILSAWGHSMLVTETDRFLLPNSPYTDAVDVACGGFACWIKTEVLDRVGGFDENLGLFWHEDDDYSVRTIKAGYEIFAMPHARVVHHEHKSGVATPDITIDGSPKNREYLAKKWRALGVISKDGRVIHSDKSWYSLGERELPEGLIGKGFSSNCGGYYWLSDQASLQVPKSDQPANLELRFALQVGDLRAYSSESLKCSISIGAVKVRELSFSKSDEIQEVRLIIPASKEGVTVSFANDACFFEALSPWSLSPPYDYNPDLRKLSLKIRQISVHEHLGNLVEHFSLAQTKEPRPDTSGIDVSGPLFEECESTGLTRSILQSLNHSHTPIKYTPKRIHTHFAKGASQNQGEFLDVKKAIFAQHSPSRKLHVLPELPSEQVATDLRTVFSDWRGDKYGQELKRAHPEAHIITLSQDDRTAFLELGFREDRVSIAPFPIAEHKLRQVLVEAPPVAQESFVFATKFAWLDPYIWSMFLLAWAETFKPNDPVSLIICGQDSTEDPVTNLVDRLLKSASRSRAQMAPMFVVPTWQSWVGTTQILSISQCFVQLSPRSADSRSILEAMALGVPVIGHNWGLQRELLADGRGFSLDFESSYLLEHFSAPEPTDPWAHRNPNNLIQAFSMALRRAYEKRDTLADTASRAHKFVKEHHSFEAFHMAFEATSKKAETVIVEDSSLNIPSNSNISISNQVTIGIDARTLNYAQNASRGIGQYSVKHLGTIMRLRPDWQFNLYSDDEYVGPRFQELLDFPNATLKFIPARYDEPTHEEEIYHIVDPMSIMDGFDSPFMLAPHLPLTATFYDLIPLTVREAHYDKHGPCTQRCYMRRLEQIRRTNPTVFAISECTRQDLHRIAQVPLERIITIMAGLNSQIDETELSSSRVTEIAKKYGISGPFFMSVGGLDGHKGFQHTILAYAELRRQLNINLVCVGSHNDPFKQLYASRMQDMGVAGAIFPGFIPREDLDALYKMALGLVFPSDYEGFGLPVLEAMAHGCPVITTRASSLPEVAGDAALLVDAGHAEQVFNAMLTLIRDSDLRANMRTLGYLQARKFTWEKSAGITIASWEKILGIHSPSVSAQWNPHRPIEASPIHW